MKFTLITAILVIPYALAAPAPGSFSKLRRTTGESVKDSYIVVLKDNASRSSHIQSLHEFSTMTDDADSLINIIYDDWEVLNGYAATLGSASLERVLNDPDVDYVEPNYIVSIDVKVEERNAEAEPNREPPAYFRDVLKRGDAGSGVDIYSIDTGVYIDHTAFGGRAKWGKTFGGYKDQDGHGHGTHTMGIAAGVGYGPATAANIIAVKVLSDQGQGSNADVVGGINWVTTTAKASGKPSVANMSLGGNANTAVDSAVTAAILAGVHFAVAAGNDGANAVNVSPARVAAAVTVGAIDNTKAKASWSNYGPVLDVWFYGVKITSSYIGSTSATAVLSGTSMAAPGVTGILAVALGEYGTVTPGVLADSLITQSVKDVTGSPSGTTLSRAIVW